jgi:AAA15 family ATPase/GTPase
VYNKSYDEIENQEATWFVDPTYSTPAGSSYICNLKKEEYEEVLAPFCMSRNGQVIVCEQQGATWLPFQKFKTIKSTYTKEKKKKESIEVVCYINNKEVVDMNTDIIIEESKNIKKPMSEEQKKKISESVKKRHSEKKLQNISEKTPLQVDKPNCIYLIKDEEDEVHFYSPYVEEAMKFFRFATTIKDPTKKIRLIEVVERVVEEG